MLSIALSTRWHALKPQLTVMGYYGVGLLLMRGVSLLLLPLLTHALTPDEYGELELLLSVINLGSLLLGFGLVEALYRFAGVVAQSERRAVVARAMGLAWLIALAALPLCWLAAPLVQGWLPLATPLSHLRWVLVALPFEAVIAIPLAWLRMRDQARLFFLATVGKTLLQTAMTLGGLALGWGVGGVLASGTLSCLLLALWLTRWQWRDSGIAWPGAMCWRLLGYGGPVLVSGLAGFALSGVDRFWLADVAGSSELAQYAVASKLALAVGILLQPFGLWWYPRRFQLLGEANGREDNARISVLGATMGFLIAGLVGVSAPWLITWLTPPSYHGASQWIPPLVLAMAVRNVSDLLNLGCFFGERSHSQMAINLGTSLAGLLLFTLLIPAYGVAGVVWSLLLVYGGRAVAFYLVSQRLLWLPYRLSPLLASALLSLVLVGAGQWHA